ncbi:MAG: SDR family NAD(P)-dependent oxidoreductase, partial [Alphaproteobacteria bacterium]|nr:SDR family NAD(P)-dependent oxidoreductase [Alphaproteobacteria bacterium]
MKKILVTGADGFIGSHLTETLVKQGYEVRAMTCYNSFNTWGWLDYTDKETLKKIEIFSGDVRDSECVRQAVKGCDTVFHLAALIAIPYSYQAPESYVDTNIKGTLNVVQAAKDFGIERVIHTSTSEVYGTALYVPIDEKHPLQGQSPYSASKIGADQIALSFQCSFETPVVVVRPFNTYGPRQSARAVIPTIITQLFEKPSELKLGALSPTRDFNFVKDTVSGFIAAANAPIEKITGKVINIGSNFEVSIGDTAKIISEYMNVDVNIVCENE